jgi:hypothetical protein
MHPPWRRTCGLARAKAPDVSPTFALLDMLPANPATSPPKAWRAGALCHLSPNARHAIA